jgi:hypothetical protein
MVSRNGKLLEAKGMVESKLGTAVLETVTTADYSTQMIYPSRGFALDGVKLQIVKLRVSRL